MFSCSLQLNMKFILLINVVKIPTIDAYVWHMYALMRFTGIINILEIGYLT